MHRGALNSSEPNSVFRNLLGDSLLGESICLATQSQGRLSPAAAFTSQTRQAGACLTLLLTSSLRSDDLGGHLQLHFKGVFECGNYGVFIAAVFDQVHECQGGIFFAMHNESLPTSACFLEFFEPPA